LVRIRQLSMRQHTSAYVSTRKHTYEDTYIVHTPYRCARAWSCDNTAAASPKHESLASCSVSIRQHTSAYVSIRQHTSAYVSIRQHTSAYVSIRQHTSAHVSIRQSTSRWRAAAPPPLRQYLYFCTGKEVEYLQRLLLLACERLYC
jgi:hypothetical protein